MTLPPSFAARWRQARRGPLTADVLVHLVALFLVLRFGRVSVAATLLSSPALVIGVALVALVASSMVELPGRLGKALAAGAAADAMARAIPLLWLILTSLCRGAQSQLLSGCFLASSPLRLPEREVMAYLAVWLALTISHNAMSRELDAHFALCPLFLRALMVHSSTANVRDMGEGNELVPLKANISESGTLPYDRAVRCCPNWTRPTETEAQSWSKAFPLNGDRLVAVYACTIPSRLNHQGRLFISTGHVGFHGTAVITHVREFVVPFSGIKELRHGGRDTATIVLKSPLLMRGRRDYVSEVELCGCEWGSTALAAMLLLLGGDEEVEEASNDEPEAGPGASPSGKGAELSRSISLQEDSAPFRRIMAAHIPRLEVRPLVDELTAETWDNESLLLELATLQGSTEIKVAPWIDCEQDTGIQGRVREVTMRILVPPAPFCPRTSRMTLTCSILSSSSADEPSLIVDKSFVNHDVPYGDYFVVQERMTIVPAVTGAGIDVTISLRCVFLKSTMMQSKIEKGSAEGVARAGSVLIDILHRRAAALQGSPGTSACLNDRTTCVQRVWELQRRTTVFHSDWRAPFLPHDRQKRWRWLDEAYQLHPWTKTLSRMDASLEHEPPIRTPLGWAPLDAWSVSTREAKGAARCDGESWQYAVDFYSGDQYWKAGGALSVRRRLWVRTFVLEDGHGAASDDQTRVPS